MKRNIYILLSLLLMTCFSSCRKEAEDNLLNPNSRQCRSYLSQFEAVWQGMDQGYVFWGRDSVDWDARYEEYQPIFAAFDKRPRNNPVTWTEYYDAYEGLFHGLLDHHLAGRFWSAKDKFETWVSPGQNNYSHESGRQKELQILRNKCIPGSYVGCDPFTYANLEFPGTYFCLFKGKNEGELIAYFRFTNFYLMQMYQYYQMYGNQLPNGVAAQAALKAFYGPHYEQGMSQTVGYANNDSVVGLIIDLRGNGGGSVADLLPFIGSLSMSPTIVGYTRVKDGFGRLDYSPWSKSVIGTPSKHLMKEKPVVVLADVTSVSCAEVATMLIKSLPYGVFIGERTYGAVGGLYANSSSMHDMFYGGCFGDQEYFNNGPDPYSDIFSFYVYTSTYHMVDKDYNDVEGVGVQPDIEVKYNKDRLAAGYDNQLDRALRYIRVGH